MKNQVEYQTAKQNQAGMNKAEQPAENKPNRLVLPLGQTIFLPQTAMGVSYIDKVRTRVYLDSVQPKDMQPLEITAEDMPSREMQSAEIQERLESKFGSPAQPKSAEELLPKAVRSSAEAKEEQPTETVEAAVREEAEPAERAVSAAKRD
ncbi:MAG: hypothetical protein OSJ64_08795, partial [Firmicutes bacterium]|nr:hypothetical protein [Bacillota bacterium]